MFSALRKNDGVHNFRTFFLFRYLLCSTLCSFLTKSQKWAGLACGRENVRGSAGSTPLPLSDMIKVLYNDLLTDYAILALNP